MLFIPVIAHFQQPLVQSSVWHDPLEIIIIIVMCVCVCVYIYKFIDE